MEITKESIFISAIRTFFKTLFGFIAILIVLIPLFIGLSSMGGEKNYADKNRIVFLPDANGNQQIQSLSAPVILQIDIQGIVGAESLTADHVRSKLIESRRGLLKNDRVKALLLRINSPGGTVYDSDQIYSMLKEYKEKYKIPIHAYIEDLCASGGVYISCASDFISSTPVSLVGSVGVVMGPFFNFTEGLDKIGISTFTFTKGKDKDMMNPFRKWTEEDKISLNNISDYTYNRFVTIVVGARAKITKGELINTYGANIFDAAKARSIGFTDECDFGYNQALEHLLKEANIDNTKPYQVVALEPKNKWVQDLFKSKWLSKGKVTHTFALPNQKQVKNDSLFYYLYNPFGQTLITQSDE